MHTQKHLTSVIVGKSKSNANEISPRIVRMATMKRTENIVLRKMQRSWDTAYFQRECKMVHPLRKIVRNKIENRTTLGFSGFTSRCIRIPRGQALCNKPVTNRQIQYEVPKVIKITETESRKVFSKDWEKEGGKLWEVFCVWSFSGAGYKCSSHLEHANVITTELYTSKWLQW